eukprot:TRINITY_DN35078_c0_g1_i1.p1 TRINITY_DN35078_c0_g1~~TRINITY_DN35078_c0_g1_i1.p1  ORF type:complete len:316 (-),score=64.81 TRINITY_DN35078_c0_g1_i1:42-989(-)
MGFCPKCGNIVSGTCGTCGIQAAKASDSAVVADPSEKREDISNRYLGNVGVEEDLETGIARLAGLSVQVRSGTTSTTSSGAFVGKCPKCGLNVGSSPENITVDGQTYHGRCFDRKCAGCRMAIKGECIEACGSAWHEKCFRCAACERTIPPNSSFVNRAGQPHCQACGEAGKATSSRRVVTTTKTVPGKPAPPVPARQQIKITICDKCGDPIIDEAFRLPNGDIVHVDCAPERDVARCAECDKALTGKFKEFRGKKMHAECVKCGICKNSVGDQVFLVNDKMACRSCAEDDQQRNTTVTYTRGPEDPRKCVWKNK